MVGMTKILFSHSYFLRLDPKQWATGQPYAPIGTLYAAALLQEQGYDVSFFDNMFAHSAKDINPVMTATQPGIFVLYDDGFNYLTKMCLTNMRNAAFDMIQQAKANNCTVIVSSSDSTDRFDEYLEKGADFILLGEAEMSLQELVAALAQKATDFSAIQSIAYMHKGCVVKTPRRAVMKDLDSLPFPAWNMIDMTPYETMWRQRHGYFSINMATTRGCPFKCNWCAKPIYGNRYNSRSPQNVVNELLLLKEKLRYDHVWFCDDIFGLKPGWVNEFAQLVKNAGLSLKFKIQSRADLLMQENYISDLAKAGCDNIWMGAESGSQKILDAMDKGTTVEQIYTATKLIKQHGMKPSFFIQFGYPGETMADIKKTTGMINELLPYDIGISVSYPLPGTVFYNRVKNELKEKTNWTDSDELALMFRNTYQPPFYRQLHRYVHKAYRSRLALQSIGALIKNPFGKTKQEVKKALSAVWYIPAALVARFQLHLQSKKAYE
jgi:anaerobic magnesium-protoporphyrin IX monomethyl ester cyclase